MKPVLFYLVLLVSIVSSEVSSPKDTVTRTHDFSSRLAKRNPDKLSAFTPGQRNDVRIATACVNQILANNPARRLTLYVGGAAAYFHATLTAAERATHNAEILWSSGLTTVFDYATFTPDEVAGYAEHIVRPLINLKGSWDQIVLVDLVGHGISLSSIAILLRACGEYLRLPELFKVIKYIPIRREGVKYGADWIKDMELLGCTITLPLDTFKAIDLYGFARVIPKYKIADYGKTMQEVWNTWTPEMWAAREAVLASLTDACEEGPS